MQPQFTAGKGDNFLTTEKITNKQLCHITGKIHKPSRLLITLNRTFAFLRLLNASCVFCKEISSLLPQTEAQSRGGFLIFAFWLHVKEHLLSHNELRLLRAPSQEGTALVLLL